MSINVVILLALGIECAWLRIPRLKMISEVKW